MSVGAWRDAAAQRTAAMKRGSSPQRWFFALAILTLVCSSPVAGASGTKAPGGCTKRKPCDTTPPVVSISAPSSGTTAAGLITVAGTASDNSALTKVDVVVDASAPQPAAGTASWQEPLDTSAYVNGNHTITARATDSAGNVGTASLSVDVSNTQPPPTGGQFSDQILSNPAVPDDLVLLGTRMAEQGSISALLYREQFSHKPWASFRDTSSGSVSNVSLPVAQVSSNEWDGASYVLTSQHELWVLSGSGPVYVRHYQLTGTPLPTLATLVSTTTFGDADSRAGDLVLLASGGMLGVWHQQGALGPQGQGIAYRSPSGSWSTIYPLQFMPTKSSRQTVAQQPADGSIWVFSDPDSWHAVGAIHLTEDPSGIKVDWTDGTFINVPKDGDFGPDPERPDVVAAADASTGTIALAYQSNVRKVFSSAPWVVGSYVAVARIAADGAKSFTSLPVYVERISELGLVVRPGETWLAYRPVDAATLTYDHLYVSRYASESWGLSTPLGTLYTPYEGLTSGVSRATFVGRLADGKLHEFQG